jgi:hypothetical protein
MNWRGERERRGNRGADYGSEGRVCGLIPISCWVDRQTLPAENAPARREGNRTIADDYLGNRRSRDPKALTV